MLELIATLQQLELRNQSPPPATTQWLQQQQYTLGNSPLRRCSQERSWHTNEGEVGAEGAMGSDENEEMEPMVMRVESGRDLRAKIYGRSAKRVQWTPMLLEAMPPTGGRMSW